MWKGGYFGEGGTGSVCIPGYPRTRCRQTKLTSEIHLPLCLPSAEVKGPAWLVLLRLPPSVQNSDTKKGCVPWVTIHRGAPTLIKTSRHCRSQIFTGAPPLSCPVVGERAPNCSHCGHSRFEKSLSHCTLLSALCQCTETYIAGKYVS